MILFQRRVFRWGLLGFFLFLLLYMVSRHFLSYYENQLHGVRGPYLQIPTSDGMTIRWQTLNEESGVVRYGSRADRLDMSVTGEPANIHELRLSGLKADSRYYYSVGDKVHQFRTAPLPGAERPVRLWVQGDPGYAAPDTMQVRDAALQWARENPRGDLPLIDLWLTTGDNAYRSGSNSEFQRHLFDAYPGLLPSVPYLPVHGNHDARSKVFFQLFSFPQQGDSGGVPSATEHYFSLDYGRVHLVFLDSMDGVLEKGSAMLQWLEKDLVANRLPWVVALMHHPSYSKGSHDSDDDADSEGRMRKVRENVVPLMEQADVDLALFGHSHSYERSHLMACHYGESTTLRAEMMRQADSSGVYRKAQQRTPLGGTIYNVLGSSYRVKEGVLDHPAMAVSLAKLGSLMIDVDGNVLTASFISPQGEVLDRYEIHKGEVITSMPRNCSKD